MKKPNVYWVDLFCGAGGTSTGIHLANSNAKVIACVNHDAKAIESHKANHPDAVHFTEDVRDFNVVLKIKKIVKELRAKEPNCIINIWASLECTHFSKAKGGMSRDADSRTLANHLYKYIEQLDPDYVYIENVREFLTWGPLDSKGKPIKSQKGIDYMAWRDTIKFYGYDYEYQLLNSADFGAYTSRLRYFGVFAKIGLPIKFPSRTHAKKGSKNSEGLQQWKAVKDVLNLEEEGVSIFGLNANNKPFATNTLKRLYYGLKKQTEQKIFLTSYYGNGTSHSIEEPCNTLTTKERYAAHFINYDYSKNTNTSIDSVAGTITTIPKHKLVTSKFLIDTQFSNTGKSIDKPCPTLIAKMDKKPMYLISSNAKDTVDNSIEKQGVRPIERLLRYYMRKHGILDIKIRMLFLEELLRIQGFPEDYVLEGTKSDKLKFIGNSVVPLMAQKLTESNYEALEDYYKDNDLKLTA